MPESNETPCGVHSRLLLEALEDMSKKTTPTKCRCAACGRHLIDGPAAEPGARPIYLVGDDEYVCDERCLRRYATMGDKE